jgi:Crinkler effector protein N-terminal domain
MVSPDLLELFCCILGDTSQNVFPVEIASDKNVGTLKKFIKNEKQAMFGHIDTNALALYKITVTEAMLDDALKSINLKNLEKLQPIFKLSRAFPLPLADGEFYVVIVWHPGGECKCSLRCWY